MVEKKRRPGRGDAANFESCDGTEVTAPRIKCKHAVQELRDGIPRQLFRGTLRSIAEFYKSADEATREKLKNWQAKRLKLVNVKKGCFPFEGNGFGNALKVTFGTAVLPSGKKTMVIIVDKVSSYKISGDTIYLPADFLDDYDDVAPDFPLVLDQVEVADQFDLSAGTPRGPPLGATFTRERLATAIERGDPKLATRLTRQLDEILNGSGASFGGRG